jgi:polyisoprenoid-binding protein YceI
MKLKYVSLAALAVFAISAAMAAEEPAAVKAPPAKAEAPAPAAATAQKWAVMPDKSSITFHGKQMGTDFEGAIGKFTPEIYFDENHLDQSKVTVTIDMTTIDGKDAERNKSIKGTDWFDTDRFPTARFETTKFEKTGDNAFAASGNLTIHGVTVPIKLPFSLAHEAVGFGQDRVIMTGSVTLDRSKFQLGTGDWADPSVIANDVPVDIKVTATAAAATPPAEAKAPGGDKPATP